MIQRLKELYRKNWLVEYQNRRVYSYMQCADKILDIGCGRGELIKLNPQKIIGLDINPETVRSCRRLGYQVKRGTALKLPFAANSFGAVNASHLIEHLQPEQVYRFLEEVSRVLRPQGIFVLSAPLLWAGFYDDLTHIKPYPPAVIMRYLVEEAAEATLPRLKQRFEKVALHWRYRPLFHYCLYPLSIHGLKKDGYMLVLKKIK